MLQIFARRVRNIHIANLIQPYFLRLTSSFRIIHFSRPRTGLASGSYRRLIVIATILAYEGDHCRQQKLYTILDRLVLHSLNFIMHLGIGKPTIEQAITWHDVLFKQIQSYASFSFFHWFIFECMRLTFYVCSNWSPGLASTHFHFSVARLWHLLLC